MRFQEIREALEDLDQETQKSNGLTAQGKSASDKKYWLWGQIQQRQTVLRQKMEGLFMSCVLNNAHEFDERIEDIETEAIILFRYYRKHDEEARRIASQNGKLVE